jgi:hypothetical protein
VLFDGILASTDAAKNDTSTTNTKENKNG